MSATDFCCCARPALDLCINRGGGSDKDPYAALSRETETGRVGEDAGSHFFQPSVNVCTWWGRGKVVTGAVVACLRWARRGAMEECEVGGAASMEAIKPVMADASAETSEGLESAATEAAVLDDLHILARWLGRSHLLHFTFQALQDCSLSFPVFLPPWDCSPQ